MTEAKTSHFQSWQVLFSAMGLLGEAASPHVNTQEPERLTHHLAMSKASQGVSVRHAQLGFKGLLP